MKPSFRVSAIAGVDSDSFTKSLRKRLSRGSRTKAGKTNLLKYRLGGVASTEGNILPGDLKSARSPAGCVSLDHPLQKHCGSYTSREKNSKHRATEI